MDDPNDQRLIAHELYNGGYGCVLPDQRFAECASWGEVISLADRTGLWLIYRNDKHDMQNPPLRPHTTHHTNS
jgi:hypothetical protein